MDEFRLIVQLLDQFDDFLIPIRCRLKPHFSKDWSRYSVFPDKSENENILLHMDWLRNGNSCMVRQFQILVFFRCPLIHERCCVMRNILEPRIPADVLQSAVPEYVGCGEENLHGHFFALRVYSVIDLALLSGLHCAVEFFQYTSVQHLEDCHYGSSVEHLLKRLRILTPLYPHSTLSIVPDFSTSNIFVDLIAQGDPGFSIESQEDIC